MRFTTLLLLVPILLSGTAEGSTVTFFDISQTATLVASDATSDTISSNGYLFTYTRDKAANGGSGRPVAIPWPVGVQAQGITIEPTSEPLVILSRVDGRVFDLRAFRAMLLANTSATDAAFEVMPLLNGVEGFADPIFFDATGSAGSQFSYDASTPQSTSPLTGFDTYKIGVFVDFALTGLTLVDASPEPRAGAKPGARARDDVADRRGSAGCEVCVQAQGSLASPSGEERTGFGSRDSGETGPGSWQDDASASASSAAATTFHPFSPLRPSGPHRPCATKA